MAACLQVGGRKGLPRQAPRHPGISKRLAWSWLLANRRHQLSSLKPWLAPLYHMSLLYKYNFVTKIQTTETVLGTGTAQSRRDSRAAAAEAPQHEGGAGQQHDVSSGFVLCWCH